MKSSSLISILTIIVTTCGCTSIHKTSPPQSASLPPASIAALDKSYKQEKVTEDELSNQILQAFAKEAPAASNNKSNEHFNYCATLKKYYIIPPSFLSLRTMTFRKDLPIDAPNKEAAYAMAVAQSQMLRIIGKYDEVILSEGICPKD